PAGPPPPPAPKPSTCCRWSVRMNPFDLIFRRLSFEGEVAIIGPLSVEVNGSWIFGALDENLDEKGYAFGTNVGFYFMNVGNTSVKPLQGMWLKAHFGYENYRATLTNPDLQTSTTSSRLGSAILGAMIGSSTVFGQNGGFALSGGIGIGVALAKPQT